MKEAELAKGGPANPVSEVLTKGGDAFGFVTVENPQSRPDSRLAGMLFYVSSDAVLQHCSATALNSPKGDLILTAGHCVMELTSTDTWKSRMIFVPAYNGGAKAEQYAPYGTWPVRHAFIPHVGAHLSVETDIAIASTFSKDGKTLQEMLKGASHACISEQGTELPRSQMWGYPGVIYDDGKMRNCLSKVLPVEAATSLSVPNCATSSGSSGSGFRFVHDNTDWVIGVVHGTGHASRLHSKAFTDLYKVASQSDSSIVIPPCAASG